MTVAEIPLQVITPAEVRASIKRARKSLEAAAEEIIWQIEMEGWRTLGYSSWTAMREAEYGGAAFMVPSKSRPEIVARIKEIEVGRTVRGNAKHLTDQEIADTVGISRRQVQDDLTGNNEKRSSAQNVESESDDDVIDAEIVDDPATFTCWVCQHDHPVTQATESGAGLACGDCLDKAEQLASKEEADPAPAEPVIHRTCPTCHGTGEITA